MSQRTDMPGYQFAKSDARGRERLEAIAGAMDPGTFALMAKLGLQSGAHCAEVGAGAGTVAEWLSAEVGNGGRVVATDIDTRWIKDRGWPNVEVRVHDIAAEELEPGAFDMVHARTVLTHLSGWRQAVSHLSRAARPGGVVLLEETDMSTMGRCFPEEPAVDRFCRGMEWLLNAGGGDPHFGPRLPCALREAGLRDVQYEVRLLPGDTAALRLHLDAVADDLMAASQMTSDDVDRVARAFADEDIVVYGPALVAAWGRP